MNKSKLLLIFSLILIGGIALLTAGSRPTQAGTADKIAIGLREQIVAEGSGQYLLYLHQQADLSAAAQISDWSLKGRYVYDTLLETARTSQVNLVAELKRQESAGNVQEFQTFFIANAILVNSNVQAFDLLVSHPDVAKVEFAPTFYIPDVTVNETQAIEWGVLKINADDVWNILGATGQGVVVANIDTGVDYDHPALVNQYRGNLGGGVYDHDFNWYDPSRICGNPSTAPCDNNNHGTHTMGTIAGGDGGGPFTEDIGIAYGARWIAAKGCESGSCSTTALLKSFEWIIAPCPLNIEPGDASCDPNQRPNVVNNSWGSSGGNTTYLTSVQNLRAAEIFPSFSAGNSGPGAGTIGSPSDYAESFAIGATDIGDVIASFSSRGPSTLTTENKPDVSAPGVNVRSSINGGGYSNFDGTSMASPHVVGCYALLKSISPTMTIDEAENILRNTAVDLGTVGPDTAYGYGRIDCFAAASELEPGFSLTATPNAASVCAPAVTNFTMNIGQIAGYTGDVTLSATGQPGAHAFTPNPVAVPGSSTLTLGSGGTAGTYNVTVTGTAPGADPRSTVVDLSVYTQNPGAPSLTSPANGATGVSLAPTYEWNAGTQSDSYELQVATDAGFSNVIYSASVDGTSHTATSPLNPLTSYYWHVRAINPCGTGNWSAAYSFTTADIPPILLVDDDDNAPNVQASYTASLDALGLTYDIWDTNNSDNEPDSTTLLQYQIVIWFTGDEFGGFAGPGSAGETALGTYLDAGNCLAISSQDYLWDRPVTAFMQTYLGVSSHTDDVGQTSVTGAGVYAGMGPYTLSYPFTNYSDRLVPDATAQVAFSSALGTAAISKDAGYKTTFWGFPWEALPTAADRNTTLATTLAWCMAPDLVSQMTYQYAMNNGSTGSGTWYFYDNNTFSDDAGNGGIWTYNAANARLYFLYNDTTNCNAFSIGVYTTPTTLQGLRICTDGSGAIGVWASTVVTSVANWPSGR